MISVILYGRNDSYGYNLHKRAAISFNCIAEVLTNADDEIIFVDTNTPDDLPTFPEAIRDTLTPRALNLLRVLRVRPATYEKFKRGTRMKVLEPLCRNIGIRRTNPNNRWVLNSNTDMVFLPVRSQQSLSEAVASLQDGLYELPRFEMPEMLWESVDRKNPRSIMEQFQFWGRRLHLNEMVLGNKENIFDGPGDFQLAPRAQLFAIHGMNEEMVLGWHVDSNLCRRLYLLNGKTNSFLESYHAYHCDHTRVNTMMHTPEGGTSNDWRKYVNKVVTPYLPDQAKTWGIPNEPIEEIRLTEERSSRYLRTLEGLIPGMSTSMLESALTPPAFNHGLLYDDQHVLPYLTDHLTTIRPDADVGYLGGNVKLVRLLAEFREKFGHTGRILIDRELMLSALDSGWQHLPASCLPVDATRLYEEAYLYCFDASMKSFPSLVNDGGFAIPKPSTEGSHHAACLLRRLLEFGQMEKQKLDAGSSNLRKFLFVGTQNTWFSFGISQIINAALTPYSTYLTHGFVRKDAFTRPFKPICGHLLLLEPSFQGAHAWVEQETGEKAKLLDFELLFTKAELLADKKLDELQEEEVVQTLGDTKLGRAVTKLIVALNEVQGQFERADRFRERCEKLSPLSKPGSNHALSTAAVPPPTPLRIQAISQSVTVGVDARALYDRQTLTSGVGQYTKYHLESLFRQRPDWKFILYADQIDNLPPEVGELLEAQNVRLDLMRNVRAEDVQLFHLPDPMFAATKNPLPFQEFRAFAASAMFHDLAGLHFYLRQYELSERLNYLRRLDYLRQGRLLAFVPSEFMRLELIRRLGIAPERIASISSGVNRCNCAGESDNLLKQVRARYGISRPFLLHVGQLRNHKNFKGVLECLYNLRSLDVELVVVGEKERELGEVAAALAEANVAEVICTGFIPRSDLEALYREAAALVCLSFYEGFSSCILEAMAQGCPVVASNFSSIPQLVGDSGVLVTPTDVPGISRELKRFLTNRSLARELSAKGRTRAKDYSWEATAEKTFQAWESFLASERAELTTQAALRRPGEVARQPEPDCSSLASTTESAEIGRPTLVAWEGSFLDHGSLSYVNRELTDCLSQYPGVRLTRVNTRVSAQAASLRSEFARISQNLMGHAPADVNVTVRHGWPPNWVAPRRGSLIVIQPWEFGSLPEQWVHEASSVNEFWVPSAYVRQVYVSSGVPADKVEIVPNGVNPKVFRPDVDPLNLPTRKSFKFLFVGGTIHRKGPDILLQSYIQTFTSQDDVCLVIKDFGGQSFYAGQTLEARIKAAQAQAGAPEVLYLNEELPSEALPGLYTACDCLVHPYRGEGFGLPILEAMACGLPVIVTAGGAADDFAREGFAYRIPSVRRAIGDSISGMKLAGLGWLLEPDAQALAARMKWVREHRADARELGMRASVYARRDWTWDKAAAIAADRLRKLQLLADTPVNRTKPKVPRALAPSITPPCGSVGQLGQARELMAAKRYPEAWQSAVDSIRKRPYHPEAFLVLAEIAATVGNGQAAGVCAQRACRLAPGWKPARQFLNRRLKGASRPEWLVLSEFSANLSERLTVCIIARNEERFINQCLASVKPIADQMVVIDTGSNDRTVEVAKAAGAEVHEVAWTDDFSAARNAALERARGDWVLILDADEELPSDQHARLKADLKNSKQIALRLPLVNAGQEAEGRSCLPRLFRNAPGAYFAGRIHEQVFPSLIPLAKAWGLSTGFGTAQLLHHGYTKELIKDRNKVQRNLHLLRQAVAESPEDPNLVMNLGLELVRSGDPSAGLPQYRQAFDLMAARPSDQVGPELCEALLTQFTTQLYKAQRHEETVKVLSSPLARRFALTASLHFALGLACFSLKQYEEAARQMRQCLAKRGQPALTPINTSILTTTPNHCLATCLAQVGDFDGAEKAFQAGMNDKGNDEELRLGYAQFLTERGRGVEAVRLLHAFVAENPQSAGAWRLGGKICLGHAEFLEVARDWTGEAFKQLPHDSTILAQHAEALLLTQQTAAARGLWEILWHQESQPRALAALILCELAEDNSSTVAKNKETDLGLISRAFIDWYSRCLAMGAHALVGRVNERTEALQTVLPAAAEMIRAALAEAGQQQAGKPDLCLA